MLLNIADIDLYEFQPQKLLKAEQIQKYVSDFRQGIAVKPVVVYYDGKRYRLFDGSHRTAAAQQCGHSTIECEIRPGGIDDMEMRFRMAVIYYGLLGPEMCKFLTGFDIRKRLPAGK